MYGDLFSKPPKYTIDTSSLIDIFGTESLVSRNYVPGVWENILALIDEGVVISHIEVFREITKTNTRGEALYDWAHSNDTCFKDYDWVEEGKIIRLMSPRYTAFVNGKDSSVHADPWLVAQAKRLGLTVITEEKLSASANPARHRIPNVCGDPMFGVACTNLLGLIKEQGWTFKAA